MDLRTSIMLWQGLLYFLEVAVYMFKTYTVGLARDNSLLFYPYKKAASCPIFNNKLQWIQVQTVTLRYIVAGDFT